MTKPPRATPSASAGRKRKSPSLPGIGSPKLLEAYAQGLRFLKREYVTGVGIGYAQKKGQRLKTLALSIHVSEKCPDSALTKSQRFPRKMLGVRVDVVEVNIRPQLSDAETDLRQFTRNDTLQPGMAIKTEAGEIGTVGLLVRGRSDQRAYILGSGHVLGTAGTKLFQPNRSIAPKAVGTVISLIDAPGDSGIAEFNGRGTRNQPIASSVIIGTARSVRSNDELLISGAFSGLRRATVEWIGRKSIKYGPNDWRDVDGFQLSVSPSLSPLTRPGDSGALWFDSLGAAVGLHVGGDKSWAFACNIVEAMGLLDVELV